MAQSVSVVQLKAETLDAFQAYIAEAVRTPVARRGGGLATVHPADLGAAVLTALVSRAGIDPAAALRQE